MATRACFRNALWAACVAACAASVSAADRAKLEKLNEDIRRHQREIKETDVSIDKTADYIYGIDKRLEDIDKTLADISAEVTETSGRLAAVQTDLAAAEAELAARQTALKRHLRLVYKLGRYPIIKILIGADDFSQMVRRIRFAMALAREDRRLARAVARRREDVQKDRDALGRELSYLTSLQRLKLAELETSQKRRAQKMDALRSTRKRRDALAARLKELKKERQELDGLLRAKTGGGRPSPKYVRAGPDLLARHGKIASPVAGKIIRAFGLVVDDRYDTVTQNDGVDIAADLGTPVKAALKGKIIFADWFRGYGKLMIVDHGGGYTSVYAHLGNFNVAPGDKVAEGQAIATVGDTGYVATPTLHFEIRRDGVAVDPGKWLK